MIYYSIPWDTGKNIGRYYNTFMQLLCNDDFACFVDGDATFTTHFFGKQLEDIVQLYPECGLFTATCNRIGCTWQRQGLWASNDINLHRRHGEKLFKEEYSNITDCTQLATYHPMGGVLILIKKSVWKKIGGFAEQGMLSIDNDIHRKAHQHGEKVYLMKGVYLYHWYRGGNRNNKQHLL